MLWRPNFGSAKNIGTIATRVHQSPGPERDDIPVLRALFKTQKPTRVAPRSPLFHEGDVADYAYLLETGVAGTHRFLPNGRRILNRFLFPGEVIGLEFDDFYPFTAEAIQEVVCYRLTTRHLQLLREHSAPLQHELVSFLRRHIATSNAEIFPLMHQHAEARIARLLSAIARRTGCAVRNGARIELPMSRADIADFLGLTVETVCRTFTKLKSERVLALLSPEKVEVTNADRLHALAEEEEAD